MNAPEKCFEDREFPDLLDLDREDPRCSHLQNCTRCQARLMVYREFMEDRSTPLGADPADAAQRLRRAFREETIGGEDSGQETIPREEALREVEAIRGSERGRTSRRASRPNLGRYLVPPRPAWIAALSMVVLVAVLYGLKHWPSGTGEDRLRSASSQAGFAVISAEGTTGGSLVVRWRSVSGATAYRLVFLDAAMTEKAGLGPVRDTTLAVSRELLPSSLAAGTPAALEVIALSGEREIAVTPPRPVRLP